MENLTEDKISLFDKLYNLSGEDNVVIEDINNKLEKLEQESSKTLEEKINYEDQKTELENELASFKKESEQFVDAFKKFDNSSFNSLKAIGIDLEIGTVLAKMEGSVPEYIDDISSKIDDCENQINNAKSKLDDLTTQTSETNEELLSAEKNRDQVKELLDDLLINDNTSSYTRGFIGDLLNKFNIFKQEDIKKLEYLLLFPENGLIEYEEMRKNKPIDKITGQFNIQTNDGENEEDSSEENTSNIIENTSSEENVPIINEINTNNDIFSSSEDSKEEKKEEPENNSEIINLTMNDNNIDENKEVISSDNNDEIQAIIPEPSQDNIIPSIDLSTDEDYSLDRFFQNDSPKDKNKDDNFSAVESNDNKFELTSNENVISPIQDINEIEAPISLDDIPEINNNVVNDSRNEEKENNILNELNINLTDLDHENKDTAVHNICSSNIDILKRNIDLFENIDIDRETICKVHDNNYMYITDEDIINKINILRSKGINDKNIKQLIIDNSLQMNMDEFNNRLSAASNAKEEITENNYYLLNHNLQNYYNNLELLKNSGYELDEKEARNNMAILENCEDLKEKLNIIKEYDINLLRKNGKFSLGVLLLDKKDLMFSLDNIIESNLENQCLSNPELLDCNNDNLLARIKYLKQNSIPLINSEDGSLNKLLLNYELFSNTYPDATLSTNKTTKEINEYIIEKLNPDNKEFNQSIVNILDNYYDKKANYIWPDIIAGLGEKYSAFKEKSLLEIDANLVSKNTYEAIPLYISKKKLERNLALILDELKSANIPNEKELIIIAALYNHHEETTTIDDFINKAIIQNGNGGQL